MKGYIENIEERTLENENFREVLYTGERLQLVMMSLLPTEEIGEEVHQLTQFIRIEEGEGVAILDGKEHHIGAGSVVIVPDGVTHNIINTAAHDQMKLYTVYVPPQHKPGVIHKTKADAEAEERAH